MYELFRDKSSFNEDISGWDVSNVTTMQNMFRGASSFNQPIGGDKFGTGNDLPANFGDFTNATDSYTISYWAYNPSDNDVILATTEISVGYLQFHKITLAGEYKSLTSAYIAFSTSATINSQQELIDIFNNANFYTYKENWFTIGTGFHNISLDAQGWDVSNVTEMKGMFWASAFNQSLDNWNVSKVTNMNNLFNGLSSFDQSINNWDVSQVTEMDAMFTGATSFNQPLNDWNVSGLTRMWHMFYGATSFNQNISGWDVSNISEHTSFGHGTSSMPTMFQNSNLYGYFNYTFGTDLINNSRFSYSTGGIEQVWGYMNVSNISGWEVSNGVNVVTNDLNAWNNPSGFKRTFTGTPPSTINLHNDGTWISLFYYEKVDESPIYVRYQLYYTSNGNPVNTDTMILFEIDANSDLILNVNEETYGDMSPFTYVINGTTTVTSGRSVVNINDDIELWNSFPTLLAHLTVPSELAADKNFVALQGNLSSISQTINIAFHGTYTLTFLCARREPEGMSIYNYFVPILIELTGPTIQTSVTHKLSSSVFESFSTDYVINATGDFTLTISNAIGSDEKGTADVFIADVKFIKTSDSRTELDTAITAWEADTSTPNAHIGAGGLNGTGGAQGTATESYSNSSGWAGVAAFNNTINTEDCWATHAAPAATTPAYGEGQWVQFDVGDNRKHISMYRMWARSGSPTDYPQYLPTDWRIEGSDDDINWTILDTRTGINNDALGHNLDSSVVGLLNIPYSEYKMQNPGTYRYYRLYVVSTNRSIGVFIGELAYYETKMIATATYGHISNWNVSNVTNMDELFSEKYYFNENISNWDVSNVTSMYRMFFNARDFNQEIDLSLIHI